MDNNAREPDRIVVVGSGFGVWMDNRHVASGRWSDVTEMRESKPDEAHPDDMNVIVTLLDGTEVSIDSSMAGYQNFLSAAESRKVLFKRRGV